MSRRDYEIIIKADINDNVGFELLRKGQPVICNEQELKMVAGMCIDIRDKIVMCFDEKDEKDTHFEDNVAHSNPVVPLVTNIKVNTDKFIALLIETYCYHKGIDRTTVCTIFDDVLEQMGFKVENGNIVELKNK